MVNTHTFLLIAVIAVVTYLLRSLPFLIFSGGKTPAFITYLGKVLPYAIMGMLVVYCLKDMSLYRAQSSSRLIVSAIALRITSSPITSSSSFISM